jgi:hypothetical protein
MAADGNAFKSYFKLWIQVTRTKMAFGGMASINL